MPNEPWTPEPPVPEARIQGMKVLWPILCTCSKHCPTCMLDFLSYLLGYVATGMIESLELVKEVVHEEARGLAEHLVRQVPDGTTMPAFLLALASLIAAQGCENQVEEIREGG